MMSHIRVLYKQQITQFFPRMSIVEWKLWNELLLTAKMVAIRSRICKGSNSESNTFNSTAFPSTNYNKQFALNMTVLTTWLQ